MTPDRFFLVQFLFFLVWVSALLYVPVLRPVEVTVVKTSPSPGGRPPGPVPPPRPPVGRASRPPAATFVPPSASASPPMAVPVTPASPANP